MYYVKQNGKNSYRFYEELEEQQPDAQARKNDLEVLIMDFKKLGLFAAGTLFGTAAGILCIRS